MTSATKSRPGEFTLIDRYFRPLAVSAGAFGLVDDAARYRPRRGEDLVLTADMISAGVHFLPDDPPASIARKALRVNLSDLAAKGATPVGYLLALALPADWTEKWIRGFVSGLRGDQKTYNISLFGGDTTRAADALTIAVTAIGTVPRGKMVLRSGARPGDAIFVSGTIGDGALGLRIHNGAAAPSQRAAASLRDRYLHPRPRMGLAALLRRYATSAMDVSDGLVGDLTHICRASGVGAEIQASRIPLSRHAKAMLKADFGMLATILTGGDDYEILATVKSTRAADFARKAEEAGVPVTRIGQIVEGNRSPIVFGGEGKPIKLSKIGHTHF